MSRPPWQVVWMAVALAVSGRSTCPRGRVGAVIVDPSNVLISTGYNGAPSGTPHCVDVGCEVDATGSCRRAVHAEANALLRAGRLTVGSTLYSTVAPCPTCAGLILNAGITRVVYLTPYRQVSGVRTGTSILEAAGVSTVLLDSREVQSYIQNL